MFALIHFPPLHQYQISLPFFCLLFSVTWCWLPSLYAAAILFLSYMLAYNFQRPTNCNTTLMIAHSHGNDAPGTSCKSKFSAIAEAHTWNMISVNLCFQANLRYDKWCTKIESQIAKKNHPPQRKRNSFTTIKKCFFFQLVELILNNLTNFFLFAGNCYRRIYSKSISLSAVSWKEVDT